MNSHNAIPYPKATDPNAIIGWYWSPEYVAAHFIAEDSLYSPRDPSPADMQQKAGFLTLDVQMAASVTGMSDRQANAIAIAAFRRYAQWLDAVRAVGETEIDPAVLASFTYGPIKESA